MQTSEITTETCSSFIWGRSAGQGELIEQTSPVDGCCFHKARMLSNSEMGELFGTKPNLQPSNPEFLDRFCSRLYDELSALRPEIVEATKFETAFTVSDSEEIVASSLEYVQGFPQHHRSVLKQEAISLTHSDGRSERRIDLVNVPYGTVAAILPQSAFLYLALTCMLNAVAAGNRVIVRSPAQSARSAGLLSEAIAKMGSMAETVSCVLASSRAFLDAACSSEYPVLIHYLGSSSHGPDILRKCFESGKSVIVDGEGNTWVCIDADVSVDSACDILTSGALRYNGETCTSINGAVIHPVIFEEVRLGLIDRWKGLTYGNPLDHKTQVGPVLDESQAKGIVSDIHESGARIAVGGVQEGNLLAPTLAVGPQMNSRLVREGLFGPALWIAPGNFDEFCSLWPTNRYPLCVGIISNSSSIHSKALSLPGVARVVINGDPSIEYIYEPWGGYPSTGNNPVSHWHQKYLRVVQVDRPI